MQQTIDARDRIAEKIVDRRIEELLDPNLEWAQLESRQPSNGPIFLGVPEPEPVSSIPPAASSGAVILDNKLSADGNKAAVPIPSGAKAFGGWVKRYGSPTSTRTADTLSIINARAIQDPEDATIHLCKVTQGTGGEQVDVIQTLKTNAEGRFSGFVPKEFMGLFEREPSDPYLLVLVAEAEGCVSESRSSLPEHWNNDMNFALEPGEKIVRGRIMVDGAPARSARVTVTRIVRANADQMDALLKQASSEPNRLNEFRKAALGLSVDLLESNSFHSAQRGLTNEKGEFELRGFGPNDLLTLEIEGHGIKKTILHVLNRAFDRVYLPSIPGESGVYYGSDFTYDHTPR